MTRYPKMKLYILGGIVLLYVLLAIIFRIGVDEGILPKTQPTALSFNSAPVIIPDNSTKAHLDSAIEFFKNNMIRNKGHVDLYIAMDQDSNQSNNSSAIASDNRTNSEALSYLLLWSAKAQDKQTFDEALDFVKTKMQQPNFGYLMWRLEENDAVSGDGSNDASDADLRAIKALLIAEKQWHDKNYTDMIDRISGGLLKVGITDDKYLAPYGGASGTNSTWRAQEVYLSYADFGVLKELSARYGEPWITVYDNMKNATLNAQIANGLYNSQLTVDRAYGNGIDAGGYSINSLWMMVKNAESNDTELMASANKSLAFYKSKFVIDAELYAKYGSDGDALSPSDSIWVYALVGRAAIALNDKDFADEMILKLIEKQVDDKTSKFYGAFPEGYQGGNHIGQFTMQESILTLQDYIASRNQGNQQ